MNLSHTEMTAPRYPLLGENCLNLTCRLRYQKTASSLHFNTNVIQSDKTGSMTGMKLGLFEDIEAIST